jgi:hypothetical protein
MPPLPVTPKVVDEWPKCHFFLYKCDVSTEKNKKLYDDFFQYTSLAHSSLGNIFNSSLCYCRVAYNIGEYSLAQQKHKNYYFFYSWEKLRLFLSACNISQTGLYDWGEKRMKKKYIELWLPYEIQFEIIDYFVNGFLLFKDHCVYEKNNNYIKFPYLNGKLI